MSAWSKNKGTFIETMETSRLELFLCKEILLIILNPRLQANWFRRKRIRHPKFILSGEESRTQRERTDDVGVGFMGFGRQWSGNRRRHGSETAWHGSSENGFRGIETGVE
jgi:hypothetical protein